ncbi:hypothetical protein ABET51_05775 [Metabacillus fastidiosus]|uniref:hypothetical protein n=1 Tax=Metabacillus fastidiosus TaxID=1458 RepID=UPI003D29EF8F
MKRLLKNNKKLVLFLIILFVIIAGLLDIKYEGLFYQLLPHSIQSYLTGIFK